MSVNVIGTSLRIIFVNENGGFGPEFRITDGFDQSTDGEVVVGHMGGGGDGTTGVVLGKIDDGEVWQVAGFFEFPEFLEESIHSEDVGYLHVPTGIVARRVAAKVGDADVLGEFEGLASDVFLPNLATIHGGNGSCVVHFSVVAE